MKKNLLSFLLLFAIVISGFSQVPDAFNYQSVVRNSSGEVIVDQNVSFRISILQDSETGTLVYVETHSVLTNDFGLANLKIGQGTILSGSFDPGTWGLNTHFLKLEIDAEGGSTYTHMGTSQLLSVPYAFHAQTVAEDMVDDADADASNELQTLAISGSDLTISSGNTVAMPESPWISTDNGIQKIDNQVSIGATTNSGLRKMQVVTGGEIGIAVENNSTYGSIYVDNAGAGPAIDARDHIRISDGTQGEGKVLTSDASGNSSWQAPAIIAYANVTGTGSVHASSGNVTVERTAIGEFRINIEGVTYSSFSYVTSATTVGDIGLVTSSYTIDGYLLITTFDTSGVVADRSFSFVVYKP